MRHFSIVCILLFFVIGCTAGSNTTPKAGATADTALQTFDWFEYKLEGAVVKENNKKTQAVVEQLLEKQLRTKRYRKISAGETPDILIGWYGNVTSEVKQVQISRHYKSRGYGTLSGYVDRNSTRADDGSSTVVYRQGTLIVDKINPHNKKVEWRDSVSGALKKEMSDAEGYQFLERAITKVMKKFPEAK
ncbi:MAG: DUF4136 domain-containing protein [Desulfobulbaceae bacterium]|nr:MAG: DUF4136 domain-containing protein [Desulfobulbaceae bacterium]